MRLRYAKLDPGNFGDELNAYIWPRLFQNAFDRDDGIDFIGIGTILSSSLNAGRRRKVVFGAGAGYWKPPIIDSAWRILFVRGPRTADLLGLHSNCALTDGAYCLDFVRKRSSATPRNVVFMPHHKSEPEVDWAALCSDLGLKLVSPTSDVESVLEALSDSKLIITEAMHGAIVADLYRIPWVPVRYGFRSLDFKWWDWCESISVAYEPIDMPPLLDAPFGVVDAAQRLTRKFSSYAGVGKAAWKATPVLPTTKRKREYALRLLREVAEGHKGYLSQDSVLESVMIRLRGKVEELKGELANQAL